MRPFFRYFGSKWLAAKHYGPPRRDLVIEPFAGSAAYSVYWNAPRVRLYDLSEDVVAAWHWLINSSEEDVRKIPDKFRTTEEWEKLPDGPRQVVWFTTAFAAKKVESSGLRPWYLYFARNGKHEKEANEKSRPVFWGPNFKDRIIRQKPAIRDWKVELLDYRKIPLEEAHYHVDPPYSGPPGRGYPHNRIDYAELAEWVRALPGAVDVCENEGADWLPFSRLCETLNSATKTGSRSVEVVWRNGPVNLLDLAATGGPER